MKNATNYIQFNSDKLETAKGKGKVSTLDRDLDITVHPFESKNDKAPSHQVFAKSPAGHDIPVGGIWVKKNANGGTYYTLSIKRMNFNANLGRYPGKKDAKVQAIIEWEPRHD